MLNVSITLRHNFKLCIAQNECHNLNHLDLGELMTERSIVAEVDGQVWDMHRPLEDNCTLRLLNMKMKDEDPYQVRNIIKI